MKDLTLPLGFVLIGAALMLALLGLGVAVIMPGLDRWSKRFFVAYFLSLALYVAFSLAEEISYMRPVMWPAQKLILYLDSFFPSVLMPLTTVYLLRCCGKAWVRSRLFRVVAALWTVYFILLNMTPFTTWFYSVAPENRFVRGPLYPLLLAFLFAIMVLNLAAVFRWRDRLSRRYCFAFLASLLPMAAVTFLHFFTSVFELLSVGIVLGALSMLGIILSEQIGEHLRQQRELAHQRASIMVLQMRPHFIYNTMMSIYYLCKLNPDLAQQVTLDFTTYLRKNFTAIAREEPILFSDELAHTRAYLAVEQAQFDDRLVVDCDTPHTQFRLPPLTLQPIVENAVKHGMDPDSEPLHILIRTEQTDSGSEITVENNGTDYEPARDSGVHIALENIRQRLEMMCGGSMEITPREGGGTVVRVTIPERGEDEGE